MCQIAANSSTDVTLEWDTTGFEVGTPPLLLSLSSPTETDLLEAVIFEARLVSDDAVFVLFKNKDNSGGIVGLVSKPSVATAPIYPPTATPTSTPTPTATGTPTATPTASPTPTTTPTPSPTPTPTSPPIIDAEIVSIVSNPSGAAVQGQWVEIYVTVLNNGSGEVGVPVRLTFPSQDKQPETIKLRIPANESATANFTWKTRNYAVGLHALESDLLLDNNTTAGRTDANITLNLLEPTISASITGFSAYPEFPVVGDAVEISVAVKNEGILPANLPVTLHYPSGIKQPETRKPRAEPGETVFANFTWRTGRYEPGNHAFRVAAPGVDRTFTVALAAPAVDFKVIQTYGPNPDVPIIKGDRVDISALVRNEGPQAGRATVHLRDTLSDRVMYTEIVSLGAHESQMVEFNWKTLRYDLGAYRPQVVADAPNDTDRGNDFSDVGFVNLLSDRDLTIGYGGDDPASRSWQPLARPDLPVSPNFSIGAISWTPEDPVVGDAVEISVDVLNHGTRAVSAPVTLHFPSQDKQPETRSPRANPGAVATATFTWRTSRYEPGNHAFRVAAPGVDRTFTVALAAPAVDFRRDPNLRSQSRRADHQGRSGGHIRVGEK